MTMPALMSHDIMPDDVREHLLRILHMKKTMGEFGEGLRILPLDRFIEERLDWVAERGFNNYEPDPAFAAEAEQLLLHALGV
jgi:predicted nucleotidyltransferase